MNLLEKFPWVSPDAFVAPNATVVGEVDINTKSSVMYGAVVRGMVFPPTLSLALVFLKNFLQVTCKK